MKAISALLATALLFSLGNSLAVPVENGVDVRDVEEFDVRGLEDALDVRDLEDALEIRDDALLSDRAVKPKFTFTNFPRTATCARQTYTAGNVRDAGDQAGKLQTRRKQVGKNKYPHVFNNRGNEIKNFDRKCRGPLYEFPILQNKKVYLGTNPDDPGPDRVVVNVSAMNKKTGKVTVTFCGLMTHTGAKNRSSFTTCSWK
ncbi:Ribonuclease/ribotoxin [Durotheca rogersii]|uniref:Ribonuclease/ribotoxin n=1 Tax=Durotheca rogersii TaxID=419775 RepID=UPI00221E887D|nr:Ribonuclease/ribotoxin [Durotheca rogersii]KAI5863338.1 Ribonuclease/ribotoxin [Durotheca rogersii]